MPSASTNLLALVANPAGATGIGDTGVAAVMVPGSNDAVRQRVGRQSLRCPTARARAPGGPTPVLKKSNYRAQEHM